LYFLSDGGLGSTSTLLTAAAPEWDGEGEQNAGGGSADGGRKLKQRRILVSFLRWTLFLYCFFQMLLSCLFIVQ